MRPTRILFASLMLLCLAATASADLKIKSRSSFGGQAGPETTTYIKGKRQRAEMPGQMATITQCDLRRTVQLNGATKTFVASPFDDPTAAAAADARAASAQPARAQTPARRGGTITTTVTSTDTGERRQMFGYTARRIKTTMLTESSPDACNPQKMRMEADGWYIDLNVGFDCYDRSGSSTYRSQAQGGCQDTYRMKQAGAGRTGYPVQVTTTMFDESGRQTMSFTQEVVEISKAVLDAALFDVPAGYREVKDMSEMYSAASGDDADADVDSDATTNDDGNASSAAPAASRPAAEAPPASDAPAAPKQSGGGLKSRLRGLKPKIF